MEQNTNEPSESGTNGPHRPILMLVLPRKAPGRLARFGTKVKVAAQFLALPVLVLVTGAFWETVDLGIDWALATLGIELVFVVLLKPLLKALTKAVRDVRGIRRLRKLTKTTSPRLPLEALHKLELCPGSGRSVIDRQDWTDDKCQHCNRQVSISNDRIVDHLVGAVHNGASDPVECDPRLIPRIHQGLGRDQQPLPPPPAMGEDRNLRGWSD